MLNAQSLCFAPSSECAQNIHEAMSFASLGFSLLRLATAPEDGDHPLVLAPSSVVVRSSRPLLI